jgi:hypothetical protein
MPVKRHQNPINLILFGVGVRSDEIAVRLAIIRSSVFRALREARTPA